MKDKQFKKWLREYKQVSKPIYEKIVEAQHNRLPPENLDSNLLQHYLTYRINKSNKSLVWATWFLAIATIVLIMISLFVK